MVESILSQKFIKKWMRLARQIAIDNETPCSRKVGSIIVTKDNIVKGMGYNGNPRSVPNCDSAEYIKNILIPKLDEKEFAILKEEAALLYHKYINPLFSDSDFISKQLDGCGICPRRLLRYKPGERTDLCFCQHAERNAISNASGPVNGDILLGWCCVSCSQCTGSIINARISEAHFLNGPEYESGCLLMYRYANIPVFLHDEKDFL